MMYSVEWEIPIEGILVSYRRCFDTQRKADIFADDLLRASFALGISEHVSVQVSPP